MLARLPGRGSKGREHRGLRVVLGGDGWLGDGVSVQGRWALQGPLKGTAEH